MPIANAPLLTHEIGSLAKPSWRVKSFANTPLNDKDIEEAERWGKKLGIADLKKLTSLLAKKQGFTAEEKDTILNYSSLFATRLQEKSGLDLVWDGEQHRVEMYEYPVRRMKGFTFRGHVRSFDNKYYRKASCIGVPEIESPFHTEEYDKIASFTDREVKIPITGAYTLVDWSFDEHYLGQISPGMKDIHQARLDAREHFLGDIAKRVIYPSLCELCHKGVHYLQIDEPAAATKRDETKAFINSMKHSIGDLAGKAFFSVHICFSDYNRLFPDIYSLDGILNEVHLEYANRDSKELGTTSKQRLGYEILHKLKKSSFVVGLGVLDVHTDFVESPELVRDRILYACDVIGDPRRIFVAPDCGLRTRTWDIAMQKMQNMVLGRDLALKKLGIKLK